MKRMIMRISVQLYFDTKITRNYQSRNNAISTYVNS